MSSVSSAARPVPVKRYRFSVCKGPDCRRNGSDGVFEAAKAQLSESGLSARCELFRGGCYGLCHMGPNVVVREEVGRKRDPFSREDFQLMGWDEEAYYSHMTPAKVRRVMLEHVGEDQPVDELLGDEFAER